MTNHIGNKADVRVPGFANRGRNRSDVSVAIKSATAELTIRCRPLHRDYSARFARLSKP